MSPSESVSAAVERPVVSSVKQQAKRLVRLAKERPLQITALNQALDLVSKLHGYPDWHTLSQSSGGPRQSSDASAPAPQNKLFPVDPSTHVQKLGAELRRWSKVPGARVNAITPHFSALRALPHMEEVLFVSAQEMLEHNLLAFPLGSSAMMANHRKSLAQVLAIAQEDPTAFALFHDALSRLKRKDIRVFEDPSLPLPKGFDSSSTWRDLSRFHVGNGDWDSAIRSHHRAALCLADVIPIMQQEEFVERWGLKKIVESFRSVNECAIWGAAYRLPLPTSGVVVFELDPVGFSSEFPAALQWAVAAHLAALRNMPQDISHARLSLEKAAYTGGPPNVEWFRSMPSETREKVCAWYQSQVPTIGLDIWDEMEGPMASQLLGKFMDWWSWDVAPSEGHSSYGNQFLWMGFRPPTRSQNELSLGFRQSKIDLSKFERSPL